MNTSVCQMLGIDIPLFAFSHCRDVVAAVTNAGGFGVLGASSHTAEQLEHELTWIDEHVHGRPYGVDIVCPETVEGKAGDTTPEEFVAMVPTSHRDYVEALLAAHDLDPAAFGPDLFSLPGIVNDRIGRELLDVSFRHPIRLIANALGVPPQFMIERAKAEGVPVAALIGAKGHAIKQVMAGVDILVAQGTEAGGHCGEVATMVLVPEVIEAIRDVRDVPVLAAGGIVTGRQMAAAVALGAAGAWTGSVWLTTREAETAPYTVQKMLEATSRDTVRSKGRTGKLSRQLASGWTRAWEPASGAPSTLPMPLQSILSEHALRRIDELAAQGDRGAQELATYWVGQGVGLMSSVRSAGDVVLEMAEDYLEATERLTTSLGAS